MRVYEKIFSLVGVTSGVDLILADFKKIVEKLEAYADLHLTHRDNKSLQIEDLKEQVSIHEAERQKATDAAAKIKTLIS